MPTHQAPEAHTPASCGSGGVLLCLEPPAHSQLQPAAGKWRATSNASVPRLPHTSPTPPCCAADASRQPDLLAGQPCQPTAQGAGPVLTPARRPPAHPRARAHPPTRPPARPLVRGPTALTISCACAVWQDALLPYFDSPADLLAADKAMHQGDLAKYGEMVSSWHPRREAANVPLTCLACGRTGGDRTPPSQRDRAHAHHAGACPQAQRLR